MVDPTWHVDAEAIAAQLERAQKTQAVTGMEITLTLPAQTAVAVAKTIRSITEYARQLEVCVQTGREAAEAMAKLNAAQEELRAHQLETALRRLSLRETIRFWALLRLRAWLRKR